MILLKVLETPAVSMAADKSPVYIIDDKNAIAEAVSAYLETHPVLAEEQDPTVPDWAKEESKPSYSAEEVGADPAGAAAEALRAAEDYTDQKLGSASGGIDSAVVEERIAAHNGAADAHGDLRLLIEEIATGKVGVEDIVNDLTTPSASRPLSARQGVALKETADALAAAMAGKLDASALGGAVETALAQAKESGDFDGVTPDLQVGTVTTLPSGAEATVERDPASPDSAPVFHFGIPAGGDGGALPDGVPHTVERCSHMTFAEMPEHSFDALGETWWKVSDLVPSAEEVLRAEFAMVLEEAGDQVLWTPAAEEVLLDSEVFMGVMSAACGAGFAVCRAAGEQTASFDGVDYTLNVPETGIYFGFPAGEAVPEFISVAVSYTELHRLEQRLLPNGFETLVNGYIDAYLSEALGGEY